MPTTTLTWTGSFLATFPGGASTLQLRARQTWTGCTATWTNIAVTITTPSSEINVQRSAVNISHRFNGFYRFRLYGGHSCKPDLYDSEPFNFGCAEHRVDGHPSSTPVNCGVAYGALTPASAHSGGWNELGNVRSHRHPGGRRTLSFSRSRLTTGWTHPQAAEDRT